MFLNFILIFSLGLYGAAILITSSFRSSSAVLSDLRSDDENYLLHSNSDQGKKVVSIANATGRKISLTTLDLGIFDSLEAKRFKLWQKLLPVLITFCFLVFRILLWPGSNFSLIYSCVVAFSFGYIISSYRLRAKKQQFQREIDFFLPLVMERFVMAVQSGLDIIPAVNTVLNIDSAKDSEAFYADKNRDVVSKLFGFAHQLCEAGIGFQEALEIVASKVESNSLRHAFIHLGLAQKEGGELIKPLRELSDSTQLYFQESVEEEIARMPVKATMPLLCTFAGLIICFLTVPIIQIIGLTSKTIAQ